MAGFRFERLDVADTRATAACFAKGGFDRVVHLAAQAGVRYSVTHPHAYAQANLVGLLERARRLPAPRDPRTWCTPAAPACMAATAKMPFAETDAVGPPPSAFVRGDEEGQRTDGAQLQPPVRVCRPVGLRFFTVYGPWGRPDMAVLQVRSRHPGRRGHCRVQPRAHEPRLHLHRRHRQRCPGGAGHHRRPAWRLPTEPATTPGRQRRTGCSTSAAMRRCR